MSDNRIPPRSEIPQGNTWNASSVFESQDAWEVALTSLSTGMAEVSKYKNRLAEGPQTLLSSLIAIEAIISLAAKLAVFAGFASAVDKTDQNAARMNGRIQAAYGQVAAAVAYLDPELLSIGKEKLGLWMSQELDLAKYAHYFENLIRKQAHVRSAEVEELLGMVTDPFGSISQTNTLLVNADLKFPPALNTENSEVPVTPSTFDNMIRLM